MFSWRDLNAKRVSWQSLDSVLAFFSTYQRKTRKDHITIRLFDLAEKTNLAVATLTKTLKDLEENGIIEIIPNKGNNAPKTYVFKKDLVSYEPMLSSAEQAIGDQMKEIRKLKAKLKMYEDFVSRVIDVDYENEYAILKVKKAPDGTAGIPLRLKEPPKLGQKTFNPKDYQ
ncbi:MAG: winged helix-turn-helix transcriptional regulator [Thermosipho sp. (in: Bacteria)]|nr:winged helix-turn-helix transcriptional regulator [Thermosipho sp. (in: thermotogales)]